MASESTETVELGCIEWSEINNFIQKLYADKTSCILNFVLSVFVKNMFLEIGKHFQGLKSPRNNPNSLKLQTIGIKMIKFTKKKNMSIFLIGFYFWKIRCLTLASFRMRFLIIDHCALLSPSLTMHILSYNLHLKSRTMSKVAQQLVCYSKSCSDLFYGYFRYKLLIQSLKHS